MQALTGIFAGLCVVILCGMAAARLAVGAVVAAIVHGFGRAGRSANGSDGVDTAKRGG